jgi:hypothetical protein
MNNPMLPRLISAVLGTVLVPAGGLAPAEEGKGKAVRFGAANAARRAGKPFAMHWGIAWRKMTPAVCATKAVEAMAIKKHFIAAASDGRGAVFGHTENAAAVVFALPLRRGVQVYVVVAGKDSREVERLRNSIRRHVLDGPYNAKVPAKIISRKAKPHSSWPALHLGWGLRRLTRAEFTTAAKLSMQRQGLTAAAPAQGVTVAGGKASARAVAFYLETKPGSGYVSILGASYHSREAEWLRNTVRADVFAKKLPKPFAVVLCKFRNVSGFEPYPPRFYREAFTEAGAGKGREFDYFRQVTYGTLDMTGSKVFGWYTMPKGKTTDLARLKYPRDRRKLHDWGVETARAHRIDLKPFHGVIVVFNAATDSGSAGGHRVVIGNKQTDWNPTFNCHEIGHGYDYPHSWSARPDVEYGDPWDIMSAMRVFTFKNKFGRNGPGMNACNLHRIGAIPAPRIWRSSKPGTATITLAALNRPEAAGYLMALISPAPGSASKTSYVVEFRQKKGWDAGIPRDTVLVHEVRSNGTCYTLSRARRATPAAMEVQPRQEFKIAARHLTIKALRFDSAAATAKVSLIIGK